MIVKLQELYQNELDFQKKRYEELKAGFAEQFGTGEKLSFFSAPGRTEIGGNHTDHNHGKVLAAAVDLDIIAAARKTADNQVYLKSAEYPGVDIVDLNDLSMKGAEKGKSLSLLRGICKRCQELGFELGGFEVFTKTRVLKGSGLSSSAAFEVVLVTVISHLYNNGEIDAVTAAKISQYAENAYFGKPSGLMDQMASSVGSVIAIDFADTENPVIERVDCELAAYDYALCITDTGGNHAKLTDEYAAITEEMGMVARFYGKNYLREVDMDNFYRDIAELRRVAGDRAVLRAMHFFDDSETAGKEAEALKDNDFETFLALIRESGYSSLTRLQNVFSSKSIREQGVSLGIALSEKLLAGKGACRVHGGGFAGTMQAFVPLDMLETYKNAMETVFGEGTCYILSFRHAGGTKVEL